MEQFANNCQTLVGSAYTAADGVLNVESTAVPFPQVGDFSVTIFDATTHAVKVVLKVTAKNSATQWAVTAEGTDANAAVGDIVCQTITARVLNELLALAPHWVDRGDPSVYDFNQTNLTMDDSWRDLDLSSIVPAGASIVRMVLHTNPASNAARSIFFRKKGKTDAVAVEGSYHENQWIYSHHTIQCFCDTERIIQYRANASWYDISIVVVAWYIDLIN